MEKEMTKQDILNSLRRSKKLVEAAIAEVEWENKPPQHPEPGTVVEWWWKDETAKHIGKVHESGNGVEGIYPEDVALWKHINYCPVYTITPPPIDEWPKDAIEWECREHEAVWHYWDSDRVWNGAEGNHIATVTREDMEKMQ